MKKYYGYGETSNTSRWDFFKGKKKEIIDIRYCSFCHKKDMINIIGDLICSKNWVRERISKTGNDYEIELSNKYPNCIIVYKCTYSDKYFGQVIEIIDIKEKLERIKKENDKINDYFNKI